MRLLTVEHSGEDVVVTANTEEQKELRDYRSTQGKVLHK